MKLRFLCKYAGLLIGLILWIAVPEKSEALERTVRTPVDWPSVISSASVEGYNVDHYIYESFPCSVDDERISYTLPNDGCTWRVTIRASISWAYEGSSGYGEYFTSETVTTSGSFTGYSLKTATDAANAANSAANQAKTAANNANTAATSAATAAANASTAANSAVTVAAQARDAANSASTNAGTAATNSLNAYNEAVTINNKLDALSGDVNLDTSEIAAAVKDPDGTVIDVSRASHDAVEDASGNTVSAVRDSSGTVLDASRTAGTNVLNAYNEAVTANSKIDNLQTSVNNYMSMDNTPPIVSLNTVSGARATSGNYIQAVLNISDNVSSNFLYSLNGLDYEPVPTNKLLALPVSNAGPNIISVWVKDEAGNVGTSSITIRKM